MEFWVVLLCLSLIFLIKKLASPATGGARAPQEHEDESAQLEWLKRTLPRLRAALRVAEQTQNKDESLVLWVQQIKDVACDADDVADELQYEELRCRSEVGGTWGSSGSSLLSTLFPPSNETMVQKITKIRRRWEDITKEGDGLLRIGDLGSSTNQEHLQERMVQTSTPLKDAEVFGRDKEKAEIIDSLLVPDDEIAPPAVAITGMGGLGKTTLARLIYNEDRITKHFDLKMWVCVTAADVDVTCLTRDILDSANHYGYSLNGVENLDVHQGHKTYCFREVKNLDVLQRELMRVLTGMRFLLVIDNLWDRNYSKWQCLRAPLIYGEKGSKVLITTRDLKVAEILQTRKIVKLEGLPFDHCWNLFKKYAFVGGNSGEHPRLEDIGKQIVKRFSGTPLAAMTIGSALCSNLEESEWMRILESEIWELEQGEDGILSVLKLSYEQLSLELKRCFAYCSLYPKNYSIDKQSLVQQWMAQGFLQSGGKSRMEDLGAKYLDELLSRSLFQFVDGKFVIHDLIHDLACLVSRHDHLIAEIDEAHKLLRDTPMLRHLSVSIPPGRPDQTALETLYEYKNLHTLVFSFPDNNRFWISDGLFLSFKTLRVLDLSYGGIETLPPSIGYLRHLRYLDLGGNFLRSLPESLCCLYNLQTLKLRGRNHIADLPRDISNLINLRHFEVGPNLLSRVVGIGKLACLQELEEFPISYGHGIKIEDLKDMNELRGALSICNLHKVRSKEEAEQAMLNSKRHLRKLEMEWHGPAERRDTKLEEEVLEALLPPANLKELAINGYYGVRCSSWMENRFVSNLESLCLTGCRNLDSLPQLWCPSFVQEIKLFNCPQLRALPSLPNTLRELEICDVGLEELPEFCQPPDPADGSCNNSSNSPSLCALSIYGCPALRSLQDGLLRHNLRSLTKLSIQKCKQLVRWPESDGFLATLLSLQELCLENCPKLVALPAESTLSASLREISVVSCPGVVSTPLFVQLHNMSPESRTYVEKKYPNLACCFEEAVQLMRAVDRLVVEDVGDDKDGVFKHCQDNQHVSLICDQKRVWSWECGEWVLARQVHLQVRRGRDKKEEKKERKTATINELTTERPHISASEWWERRSPAVSGRRSTVHKDKDYDDHQYSTFLSTCLGLGDHPSCLLPWASSLRWLVAKGISHGAFLSLDLPSLEGMWIAHCQETRLLSADSPLSHLKGLKELQIFDCPKLTLPSLREAISSLPSLQHLTIEACPGLSSSSSSCLTSPAMTSLSSAATLQTLFVDNANLLGDAQFVHGPLTSLRGLHVWYAGLLSFTVAAQEGLRSIGHSLHNLSIQGCLRLKHLPRDLQSLLPCLKALGIKDCPYLHGLPERGLPKSLEILVIQWCPVLEGRYKPPSPSEKGGQQPQQQRDWLKIAHVPVIVVDGDIVQGSHRDFLELRAKWKDF